MQIERCGLGGGELFLRGFLGFQGRACGGRWHLYWHMVGQTRLQCMGRHAAHPNTSVAVALRGEGKGIINVVAHHCDFF